MSSYVRAQMVLWSTVGCLLVLVAELSDVVNAYLDGPPVKDAVAAIGVFPHIGGAQLCGQDRRIRAGVVQVVAGEATTPSESGPAMTTPRRLRYSNRDQPGVTLCSWQQVIAGVNRGTGRGTACPQKACNESYRSAEAWHLRRGAAVCRIAEVSAPGGSCGWWFVGGERPVRADFRTR